MSLSSILLTELSGRALLRNLRLLTGMRGSAERLRVVVAGANPSAVAQGLRALEPSLEIHEALDNGNLDAGLSKFSGGNFDSVILSQPYHSLSDVGSFATVHGALHPEEGTLGMLWARAVPSEGWTSAYTRGIEGVLQERTGGLPLLTSGGNPLTWMDELGLSRYGFEAPKHRKFVGKLEGTPPGTQNPALFPSQV